LEEWGPCPVFASYTLAFALQLRKMHEKNLSQGNNNFIIVELSFIKFYSGKYLPVSRLSETELI
jgi:hypothetical protein